MILMILMILMVLMVLMVLTCASWQPLDRLAATENYTQRGTCHHFVRESSISRARRAAMSIKLVREMLPMVGPDAGTAQDQQLRSALEGNPWQAVPLVMARLARSPGESELRLLVARALARLGLATLAREQLALAATGLGSDPRVASVRDVLEALPDDRVPAEWRASTCRGNLAAMVNRFGLPGGLDAHIARWEASIGANRAFRTSSGAVVVLMGDGAAWSHWLDDVTMARGFTSAGLASEPLWLDGVHAPALIRRVASVTPAAASGARTRITLLAANVDELLDGLSLADLRDILADDRVSCLIGRDVPARLAAMWEQRPEEVAGLVLGVPMPPRPQERWPRGAIAAELERATTSRTRLATTLQRELTQRYAGRTGAWWSERYRAARAGEAPALRVLIPTTRYSTFIKHSAEDLASALREAGCEALVHIEASDTVQHSALALPRAIAAFEPDALVMINVTRSCASDVIPGTLPVVTWCQDAMPHLFSEKSGRSIGPLDLFCGHLLTQLFDQFGYPRSRTLESTVVASARKFHAGAVSSMMPCDIAYVSHQSEPPRAMCDRLIAEARGTGDALLPEIIGGVYDEVVRLAGSAASGPRVDHELQWLTERVVRAAMGSRFDPRVVTSTQFTIVRPLAERVIRHQMLEWTRAIAHRRGWSLHLYGKGWDKHSTLAPHAQGEITHDESLRASYQSAKVHLHASINGFMHQRVMECALSGGLPLVRVNCDVLAAISLAVSKRVSLRQDPEAQAISDRSCWMYVERDEEAMRLVPLMAAWGITQHESIQLFPELREQVGADGHSLVPSEGTAWMLGPTCDLGFDSAAALERVLERAIMHPQWRLARAAALREVVAKEFTHEVLARRLITSLERGFRHAATAAGVRVPSG